MINLLTVISPQNNALLIMNSLFTLIRAFFGGAEYCPDNREIGIQFGVPVTCYSYSYRIYLVHVFSVSLKFARFLLNDK